MGCLSSVNTRQNSEHYSFGKYHLQKVVWVDENCGNFVTCELPMVTNIIIELYHRDVRIFLQPSTPGAAVDDARMLSSVVLPVSIHCSKYIICALGKTEYSMIGVYAAACHTRFTDSKYMGLQGSCDSEISNIDFSLHYSATTVPSYLCRNESKKNSDSHVVKVK